MAGMRNVLVHAYATIRRDLVIDITKSLRDDASKFARAVWKGLDGEFIDPASALNIPQSEALKGRVR